MGHGSGDRNQDTITGMGKVSMEQDGMSVFSAPNDIPLLLTNLTTTAGYLLLALTTYYIPPR
jgi:hypothetical protein